MGTVAGAALVSGGAGLAGGCHRAGSRVKAGSVGQRGGWEEWGEPGGILRDREAAITHPEGEDEDGLRSERRGREGRERGEACV